MFLSPRANSTALAVFAQNLLLCLNSANTSTCLKCENSLSEKKEELRNKDVQEGSGSKVAPETVRG